MLSLLEKDAVLLLISSYIVEDISGKTDEKLEMIKEKKKFRLLRYSMKKLNKIDPRMFSWSLVVEVCKNSVESYAGLSQSNV